MPLIEQALPRFRSLLDEVSALSKALLSKALRFDFTKEQHCRAAALHGSILEQARGIMTLLEQRNVTPVLILLRSLLDATVDLSNLVNNSDYAKFMDYTWLKENERILKATREPKANLYLAEFAEHSTDVREHLTRVRAELKQFEEQKIEKLSACERFEHAKQSHLYPSLYWYFCLHSHNNISALRERHFLDTPNGFQVVYFRQPDDDDVQLIIDTAASLVANSIDLLCRLLGGCPSLELEKITQKLNGFRALWNERA